MSLLDKIKADRIAAWKKKETVKLNLLTTLYSEAAMIGKNNGNRETTVQEVIAVIKKFIKNAEETLKYTSESDHSNKIDMINACNAEIECLTSYLPAQMDSADIANQLELVFFKSPDAKLGEVMKYFKDNFDGEYDGKLVSTLAKEYMLTPK